MRVGCKKERKCKFNMQPTNLCLNQMQHIQKCKIYEIDKLKLGQLNEDQLQLFNYLLKLIIPYYLKMMQTFFTNLS
ncbi:unnamed protein product [Paramecium sonneborni]|uniref:Uncharacterized protein n=1 Tax=Paramecium sonneborni TaxID=65129 RepID=A0A8S1R1L0_9CILI|nr:unnamed protein product [Paramecium sonneborni]